ncbi:MAG: ABC transporter ATP-binding protein, partial [Clostridia bacterium]
MKNKRKEPKRKTILHYVFMHKAIVFSMFLVLLIAVLLGRGVTFLNAYIVDNVIVSKNSSLLIGLAVTILGFLLLEAVCYFVFTKSFSELGYKIAGEIRKDLYDKIVYAPLEYYENNPVANILSKTTTYVNDFGNFVNKNFIPFLSNAMKFVAVFLFMVFINWALTLIILGGLVIIAVVSLIITRLSAKRNAVYKKF